MKKWILLVAILSTVGVVAWKIGNGNANKTTESNLLNYIPADTIYYVGGQSSKKIAEFMSKYPLFGGSTPSQNQQIKQALEAVKTEDAASTKFFTYLMDRYTETTDGTFGAFAEFTGFASTGPFVMYSHGIIPVFRVQLANTETFNTLIENAVKESGWQYKETNIGQHKVRLWPLDSEDIKMQLAVAVIDNIMTVTLLSATDDEATQQARLAMTKPKQSLAQSGELKNIKKQYKYNNTMVAFLSFQRIAQGILQPETNSFGQQLQQYLPEDIASSLKEKVTNDACRDDYNRMTSVVPRMVMGYRSNKLKGNDLDLSYHGIFEIDHESTISNLKKIRGHIPEHTLISEDKLFGFGLGINISSAPPALTAMWNAFISAEFKCDELISMQNQVKQGNPALLAMATGLVQGIQGVGASLYNIKWEDGSDYPSNASALISIAANDPQTIASLTTMVPFLSSVSIPADGTPTDIILPMMPPTIEIKAAIKGKSIVIYTGDQAQKVAEQLVNETLEPNGIYGLSANYRKFSEVLNNPINSFGQVGCIAQQEFIHMMNSSPMDFNMIIDAEDKGFAIYGDMVMSKPEMHKLNLVGEYSLQRLNESCKWEKAGNESVKQDGTGGYLENDDAGKCEVYKTGYKWKHNNGRIIMDTHMEKTRDSCNDDWVDSESQIYTCDVLNVREKQFDCIFDAGTTDATLYRYTRKN